MGAQFHDSPSRKRPVIDKSVFSPGPCHAPRVLNQVSFSARVRFCDLRSVPPVNQGSLHQPHTVLIKKVHRGPRCPAEHVLPSLVTFRFSRSRVLQTSPSVRPVLATC